MPIALKASWKSTDVTPSKKALPVSFYQKRTCCVSVSDCVLIKTLRIPIYLLFEPSFSCRRLFTKKRRTRPSSVSSIRGVSLPVNVFCWLG